jgi:hypothetical protein
MTRQSSDKPALFCAKEVVMRRIALNILMAVMLTIGVGCSTHSRTVTTETRGYPSDRAVEQRTETTTETRSESGGVLSSTVDVVGEVLALPFRAVGGLIRGIF